MMTQLLFVATSVQLHDQVCVTLLSSAGCGQEDALITDEPLSPGCSSCADAATSDHVKDDGVEDAAPRASLAAAAAADSSSGQLSQLLSELQQKPDKLMQQVLDLLDQKIAAAEAKQAAATKQQAETATAAPAAALQEAAAQAEVAQSEAAAATAVVAEQQQVGAADDQTGDGEADFVIYSAEQLQQGLPGLQAAGDSLGASAATATPVAACNTESSGDSSNSSTSNNWSAGGFMDIKSVDSGSDNDDDNDSQDEANGVVSSAGSGRSSTHWGVDQYDEDVSEHLSWYSGQGAMKQVKNAASVVANVAKSVVVPNGQEQKPQQQQQQEPQVADTAKEQ
jgi:hypothetical protein